MIYYLLKLKLLYMRKIKACWGISLLSLALLAILWGARYGNKDFAIPVFCIIGRGTVYDSV